MPYTFDLETTPAGEPTAQLNQTENFSTLARIEAQVYIAALQARFGVAPDGLTFKVQSNRYDFGTYYSVQVSITDEAMRDPATATYFEEIECGIEQWVEAGFSAPVLYDGCQATSHRGADETILGAMQSTRPNADGAFPYPDAQTLHTNLRTAYPEIALRFDTWATGLKENADV